DPDHGPGTGGEVLRDGVGHHPQAGGLRRHADGHLPRRLEETSRAPVQETGRSPSRGRTLIHPGAAGKLDACLSRVAGAGGTVVSGRTDIGSPGYVAVLQDTEGNLVALHSPRDA